MCLHESNNWPCGRVGKNLLIWLDVPGFKLPMRQILIYFDSLFTFIRTSKVFHFYFIFLDGNYRVLLTRVKYCKIPYNLNPVNNIFKCILRVFRFYYFLLHRSLWFLDTNTGGYCTKYWCWQLLLLKATVWNTSLGVQYITISTRNKTRLNKSVPDWTDVL